MLNTRIRLTLCLLAMGAVPAAASGTISNAVGAREAGRGGTNLAFSDNGVVLMDNPAGIQGLVGQCECNQSFVDLGVGALFTDLSYADAENPITDAADNPSALGHFMMARRVHEDVVFGFGAFTPAGFGSDYDLQGPATLPGQHTYKSFGALLRILPGFSAQLTERLSVGGTLGLAVSHLELEGPYYVNDLIPGLPTKLDLQATGTALSWSCGLQYALSDQTTIGARYQSENRFKSDGKASLAVNALGGLSYYDVEVALTWASSVGIGMTHQVDSTQRVALDLEWEFWSHAFDEVGLTFTNPDNPVFLGAIGPRFTESFPLRWEDSLIMSLGYEKDLSSDRTLRLGYRFQDNPVPSATTSTYLQTTLEHHFSVGYGFEQSGWEIDLAYQFAFAPDVSTGTSAYPGGDFSNALVRTSTHMLFWGAMRRF